MQPSVKRNTLAVPALLLGIGLTGKALAIDDIYETQDAFLAETFGAAVPPPIRIRLSSWFHWA